LNKKFSGYSVAVGTIIYLFFAWGIINVTSVAFAVFPDYFHASLTQISLGVTIYCVACFILSFFAGEYQKRVGPKTAMVIGSLSMAAFCFIIAFTPSIMGFYLAQLVVAFAGSTSMHACCTLVISNWFVKQRARLISICMAAALFGASAFQFVAGKVFTDVGVSRLYLYFGIVELIVLLFCSVFLVKSSPESVGQKPLGWEETKSAAEASSADNASQQKTSGVSIYKNPVFWIMLFGFTFSMLCAAAINSYTTTVLPTHGFSLSSASMFLSILTLAGGLITFFVGFVLEKFSLRSVIIVVGIGAIASNVLMAIWVNSPSIGLLIGSAIAFAVGYPFMTLSNVIAEPVFGDQAYLANPKLIAFANGGYSVIFPLLGYIATKYGFSTVYFVNAAICLLVIIPFLIALSIAKKKIPQKRKILQGKKY